MGALQGKCVIVVGRGGGIARAVTLLARSEGARVVVAGRDSSALASQYDDYGITAETVDVTDDASIAAFADRVGPVDHLVSTVSARARGKLADLDRAKLQLSFDTKVIGPAMLAKHFAPLINEGGSIVLFSGVNAFKVNVGYLGVARHQRRRRLPHPIAGGRAGPDPRQRRLSGCHRHRCVGFPRRRRQG